MRAAAACIVAAVVLAYFVWAGIQSPRQVAVAKAPQVLPLGREPHPGAGALRTATELARLSSELPPAVHTAQDRPQSPGLEDALLTEAAHRQGGPERASDDSASDVRPVVPDVAPAAPVFVAPRRPSPPLPPPLHANVASSSAEPLPAAKPEGAADDEGGD